MPQSSGWEWTRNEPFRIKSADSDNYCVACLIIHTQNWTNLTTVVKVLVSALLPVVTYCRFGTFTLTRDMPHTVSGSSLLLLWVCHKHELEEFVSACFYSVRFILNHLSGLTSTAELFISSHMSHATVHEPIQTAHNGIWSSSSLDDF